MYFTQIFLKRQSAPVSTNPLSYDSIGNQSFFITLEENTNYQVNRYRISQNLPPLRLDARISHEARLFSQKMANKQKINLPLKLNKEKLLQKISTNLHGEIELSAY